ncbi:MAG: signal peptidase I [Chloroflexota bacterium]|nr:signal peptidase I [Chloroflexota bacterium]
MKRARRIVSVGLLAAALAVWVEVLRPQALGGSALYIVVRGSSMLPTYANGDLVVVQSAGAYSVGDIVAYRVPNGEIGEGHLVIHRITGGDGVVGFAVRGDNNEAVDPWSPRAGEVAGRAWWVVPGLGRFVAFIHQPAIAAGLAAALMVTFVLARPSRPIRRVPANSRSTAATHALSRSRDQRRRFAARYGDRFPRRS